MHRQSFIWALAAYLIVSASANGYGQSYGPSNVGGSDSAAGAAAGSASGANEYGSGPSDGVALADAPHTGSVVGPSNYGQSGPNSYGSDQNIPYKPVNTKGNTLTSSITYPQNKGEILIHRPAPIIVKRPPTKVLVNHPPLVVKPAPVVLHKPPAIVLRKVYVKHHPRRVKVEPVFVNVVKPPAEKYFVNENKQGYGQGYGHGQGYGAGVSSHNSHSGAHAQSGHGHRGGPQSLPAYASGADNAAVNAGYQLLQGGNHGLSALANIAGGPSGPGAYSAPSY